MASSGKHAPSMGSKKSESKSKSKSPQNLINICPVNIPTALLEKVQWTAPSCGSFWKLMGPKNIAHDGSDPSCAIFFEKLALGVYQIWQCCRGSYEVFSRTFDALCRKSHLRTFSAFLSRKNLRTPSGKFLREKFCQPESFDFLCLCPIVPGPKCLEP